MSIFSERLKYLREKKNFTQNQMGEKLGMTGKSYSKYEYGLREPNLDTLAKLPWILQETIDFMLGVSDDTQRIRRLKKQLKLHEETAKYGRSQLSEVLTKSLEGTDAENLRNLKFQQTHLEKNLSKHENGIVEINEELDILIAEVPEKNLDRTPIEKATWI